MAPCNTPVNTSKADGGNTSPQINIYIYHVHQRVSKEKYDAHIACMNMSFLQDKQTQTGFQILSLNAGLTHVRLSGCTNMVMKGCMYIYIYMYTYRPYHPSNTRESTPQLMCAIPTAVSCSSEAGLLHALRMPLPQWRNGAGRKARLKRYGVCPSKPIRAEG